MASTHQMKNVDYFLYHEDYILLLSPKHYRAPVGIYKPQIGFVPIDTTTEETCLQAQAFWDRSLKHYWLSKFF